MNIRERIEENETKTLSEFATKSKESKGRSVQEEKCPVRTDFQRDRDRIIHSKAFRRLKHKTQVFLITGGDHARTRLTHTLEVAQIARTIARALFLNEDLTEAIALGHDLGHTPFGHAGERSLDKLSPIGFKHNEQSLRVVNILEKKGGLNLTEEVCDGILCHTGDQMPKTLEGKIIRLADKIAYINHDIDDSIRSGELKEEQIPKKYTDILGKTNSARINTMIAAVIEESTDKPDIIMNEQVFDAMMGLREFMFENVYKRPFALEEEKKAFGVIEKLYNLYSSEPELIDGGESPWGSQTLIRVRDYIAGMTDDYAIKMYKKHFIPMSGENIG